MNSNRDGRLKHGAFLFSFFNYKNQEVNYVTNNHEKMGKGVKFERIRRITGYLVGTMEKWNNAKKAEERDRVKHGIGNK